jgi:hypothetical protein
MGAACGSRRNVDTSPQNGCGCAGQFLQGGHRKQADARIAVLVCAVWRSTVTRWNVFGACPEWKQDFGAGRANLSRRLSVCLLS